MVTRVGPGPIYVALALGLLFALVGAWEFVVARGVSLLLPSGVAVLFLSVLALLLNRRARRHRDTT